jgi:fumarate reductase subunit C
MNVKTNHKIDKTPARLDFIQSATGLILALFIWAHMFFESSIIFGKESMHAMTLFFEGYYFFGDRYPFLVSILGVFIFAVFILHALVAIRKFPSNYRQYKIFRNHMKSFRHTDTSTWFIQIVTGFVMFFLGSVHLYIVMSQPGDIGPYASSDRMIAEWMWPLFLLLLIVVILHAGIGSYRLCLKWGWFEGKNAKKSRKLLKKFQYGFIAFFMTLGLLSIATYMKIGFEHQGHAGERYHSIEHVDKQVQR